MEVVAVVVFLAVGGDTGERMKPYTWEMLGLCKADPERARDKCRTDNTPQCAKRMARNLPCEFNVGRLYLRQTDDTVARDYPCESVAKDCVVRAGDQLLYDPQWVPSSEPTNVGAPGFWMKMQL